MKEEILHYIWKTKNLPSNKLLTVDEKIVEIINFGMHNMDAGPDFLNGEISIDGQLWFGHIEIHIKSSDWYKHFHHEDPKYQNVILHVVWENDTDVYLNDGSVLSSLILKGKVNESIFTSYHILQSSSKWIPCANYIKTQPLHQFNMQQQRLYIEKLEYKHDHNIQLLKEFRGDFLMLLFCLLARSLGQKVNADAMETLARKTPFKILIKHSSNLLQLEAILYGQSGMLASQCNEEYPKMLYEEYQFLKLKYQLTPMSGTEWKLLRMRPCSFPTIRISQLASIIHRNNDFYNQIVATEDLKELAHYLSGNASIYWESHFTFQRESKTKGKRKLSKGMIEQIITNAIIPFLFTLGKHQSNQKLIERALQYAETIGPETNYIIKKWKSLGIHPTSRLESQALLHLKKHYCTPVKCLTCQFGNQIMKSISNQIAEEEVDILWQ